MFSTIGLQLSCNERLIERFRLQARYVTYGSSISCQNRNEIAALTYGDSIRLCCIEEKLFSRDQY